MNNPFQEDPTVDISDETLVQACQEGDKAALEKLIARHQAWIYNITLRMVYDHDEAQDVTQEILVKIITKLSTFQGKSQFRTWLYRIVKNHVINMKQGKLENMITNFSAYGDQLERIPNIELNQTERTSPEFKVYVDEAKVGCIHGMLLCLNREQRLILILGDILQVGDIIGSEILELSRANFRQKLSRARKELYTFMQSKCGLINKSNPCRCARKTKGFIQLGVVDPDNLRFHKDYVEKIKEVAPAKLLELEDMTDVRYPELFRDTAMHHSPDSMDSLKTLLEQHPFTN